MVEEWLDLTSITMTNATSGVAKDQGATSAGRCGSNVSHLSPDTLQLATVNSRVAEQHQSSVPRQCSARIATRRLHKLFCQDARQALNKLSRLLIGSCSIETGFASPAGIGQHSMNELVRLQELRTSHAGATTDHGSSRSAAEKCYAGPEYPHQSGLLCVHICAAIYRLLHCSARLQAGESDQLDTKWAVPVDYGVPEDDRRRIVAMGGTGRVCFSANHQVDSRHPHYVGCAGNPGSVSSLLSCCIAQVSMRRMSRTLGNMDNARKVISVSSRTVVITNVSSKYSKSEIVAMFADMGIEDISSVVIVQSRKKVRKMLVDRNKLLEQLEGDLQKFYDNLVAHLCTSRGQSKKDLEAAYGELARIGSAGRKDIMKVLIVENHFAEFRPKHKVSGEEVDSIAFRYKLLIQRDDELLEAARRFATDHERYVLDMDESPHDVEEEIFTPSTEADLLVNNKTMVSWRQFLGVKGNVKDYGLTMWGTSMSIIVLFGSQRSATIAEQTLLSRRPFSMEVTPAPTPDDIIWDNLYCPQGERFTRRLIGTILYVMVNILFTSADLLISPMLEPRTLEEYIPYLGKLLSLYPSLRGILTGILAPLVYNVFLLVAPYMLYGLSIFQGRTSKTSVQESLLEKYTWLLFLQSFVVFLLSSALFKVLEEVITGQYGEIIVRLRTQMPEHAAFFMNVILQRSAISLMFVLLKPSGLLLQLLRRIIWRKSLRKRAMYWEPDRVFLGALYPVHIVFVFMVTMAFIPLTPIISLAGLIFYGLAYLVFRYHFIFCYEIPHESGGKYWMFLPTPILVGCILGQVFSIIQISFLKGAIQALCMVPLCIITVCAIVFLRNVFRRRSTYLPLGGEASDRVDRLSVQMQEKQAQTIRRVAREAGEDLYDGEKDEMPSIVGPKVAIKERHYETVPYDFGEQESRLFALTDDAQFGETATNPYCNPIIFKRYPYIMVPPLLFHAVKDATRPS
ncbi:hypothetical protein PSACC_00925 [Paramicrosporidium saccamoebae]|uniref:CSC1/OSCA1-like 7TM region domain-containing protein n=1 Tax=Paramicrosporidium saccamoebae TaxID=1246581 RepID=A0A2H9TNC0_9FUNG|nr:hypothetical protein PSACC_00925 [Paramicrosporidium saccamoebae]